MKQCLLLAASLFAATGACADCAINGKRSQLATLYVEGRQVDRWEVLSSEIRRVRLPHGFEVGVQIEPATPDKYREILTKTKWPAIDEMVKITLLDMSAAPPVEISFTWGGANSKQGFGPRGGANGVSQLIDQIELWFHKPVCITSETIPVESK